MAFRWELSPEEFWAYHASKMRERQERAREQEKERKQELFRKYPLSGVVWKDGDPMIKSYIAVLDEIEALKNKCYWLIMSTLNRHYYTGFFTPNEHDELEKMRQEALSGFVRSSNEAYKNAGAASGEVRFSLDPNARICLWFKAKQEFLKGKLAEDILPTRKLAEERIAKLMELEGSEEKKTRRVDRLNEKCIPILGESVMIDLSSYAYGLQCEVELMEEEMVALKKEANKLLDDMKKYQPADLTKASKEILSQLNHTQLKEYVEQLKQQLQQLEDYQKDASNHKSVVELQDFSRPNLSR